MHPEQVHVVGLQTAQRPVVRRMHMLRAVPARMNALARREPRLVATTIWLQIPRSAMKRPSSSSLRPLEKTSAVSTKLPPASTYALNTARAVLSRARASGAERHGAKGKGTTIRPERPSER